MKFRTDFLNLIRAGLAPELKKAGVTFIPNLEDTVQLEDLPVVSAALPSDAPYDEGESGYGRQPSFFVVETRFGMMTRGRNKYERMNEIRQVIDDWMNDQRNWGSTIQEVEFTSYEEDPTEEGADESVWVLEAATTYMTTIRRA